MKTKTKRKGWGRGQLPRGVERTAAGGFRAWVTTGGKRQKSRTFPTAEQAEKCAKEWRRQLRELPVNPATVAAAMELLRADCRATKKPGTLDSWESHYQALTKRWGDDTLLLEIDAASVDAWKAERLQTCRPSTVHHQLSLGRRLFNLASKRGLYSGENPFSGVLIEFPKIRDGKRHVLAQEEVAAVLRIIGALPLATATRDAAVIAVIAATGARRSEVARIRVGDVDLTRRTLAIAEPKCGDVRYYPIDDRLLRFVEPFVGDRDDDEPLFGVTANDVSNIFTRGKGQLKKAGFRKWRQFHAHAVRHSFAQGLVDNDVDLETVRILLGHVDLRTTQKYLRSSAIKQQAALATLRLLPRDDGRGQGDADASRDSA